MPSPTSLLRNPITLIALSALVASSNASRAEDVTTPIAPGPFGGTQQTLVGFECPEWFRDAKFGIWAHWGPQAVPRQGDWYARGMYEQGSAYYEHHLKTWGHPSKHGYKDIIPLWTASKFDPDHLMSLYKAAGAKYFVSMGVHHDNFDLWNSKFHPWNATQMGPKRDIVGEWKAKATKYGLRFGVSEHLGASFGWFMTSHGADAVGPMKGVPYDGADPKYASLYHPQHDEPLGENSNWYVKNPIWHKEWFARIKDLVDSYQPDLLYSDGTIPFENVGRTLVAHFYNGSAAKHAGKTDVVYTFKPGGGDNVFGVGIQDVERGALAGISPQPWQTDTSIGDWFYNERWKYRPTAEIVQMLMDIVSKNGNLLLNVVLRPEGDLDPEAETFLKEMAGWISVNGEAVYGTRPWFVYGDSAAVVADGAFNENYGLSGNDIRYTQSKDGKTLYATTLGRPKLVTTLYSTRVMAQAKDAKVELLGYDKPVAFSLNTRQQLVIERPDVPDEKEPSRFAYAFKLTGFTLEAQRASLVLHNPDTLSLSPRRATLKSASARVWPFNGSYVTDWKEATDSVHWLVAIKQPGTFLVSGRFLAPRGPAAFNVSVAGKTLEARIEKTDTKAPQESPAGRSGNWLEIGKLTIEKAGVYEVVLAHSEGRAEYPDIYEVDLTPAGE